MQLQDEINNLIKDKQYLATQLNTRGGIGTASTALDTAPSVTSYC